MATLHQQSVNEPSLAEAVVHSQKTRRLHALTLLLAFVVFAVLFDSYALSRPQHILALVPRSKPTEARPRHFLALIPRHRPAEAPPRRVLALLPPSRSSDPCRPVPVSTPFSMAPDALALAYMTAMSTDVPALKQAIEFVKRGKIADPAWPSLALLRRRAEGTLWQEKRDPATVRRFLGDQPTSVKGRLALARVLLTEGDRSGAEHEIREVWRSEELSPRPRTAPQGRGRV
jgi:peptidoglycan lytic transglycosylase